MSNNPWTCDDAAYGVMFSDEAEFSLIKDGSRGTVRCCVFPREETDPFADSDNESLVAAASVLVRKGDWHFAAPRPSVGDEIRLPCGDVYKVQSVQQEQNWWTLKGRSVS